MNDIPERTHPSFSEAGEEARRNLLKARAKELSRVPEPDEPHEDGFDVIGFSLGSEHYAIEAAHVREVYPAMELTPIPCTPRFVAGVINVRGDILAVIDLKAYFEIPMPEGSESGDVVIVEVGDSLFGILVDSAIGLSFVSFSDLQSPLPSLSGIRKDSTRGVTSGQLIVLDIPRMLADKKLWVHEEVAV
jgi:purine-binding chemotaxis protein CheW